MKIKLKCILKNFFFSICYKFNKNTNFYSVLDDLQDNYPIPYNLLKPYKSEQDFKTKNEFYEKFNINISYRRKMRHFIVLSKKEYYNLIKIDTQKNNNERIIDI